MVVFFPERVEVIGTQPGLEEESKVGKEPEWESMDLRRIFLPPSVWEFHHVSRFVLKVLPHMCLQEKESGLQTTWY